jgi:diguanylate cyclase (GGDEF)-like protein/PAS domain S-box-containing protein
MDMRAPAGRTAKEEDWLFGLHHLLVEHFDDLDAFALACIDIGRHMLDLSTGILSRIVDEDYEVFQVLSPIETLQAGNHFDLSDTYCRAVAKNGITTVYHRVETHAELRNHPAYTKLQLRSYLGAAVMVGGQLYGTLNFSDGESRPEPFAAREIRTVESMAALIGRFVEREWADQALRERERMFEQSFRHAIVGKVIAKPGGEMIDVNPAMCHIFGYGPEQFIGHSAAGFVIPEDLHLTDRLYEELYAGKRDHFQAQKRYFDSRGHIIEAEIGVALVRDARGEPLYTVLQLIDVSERNRAQRDLLTANNALTQLSTTDSLTGLSNRRALDQTLRREFARARRNQSPLSLIALDIDHFKRINDRYGHPVGDEVLAQCGQVLRESVRETDIATRPGGEEFTIVLPDTPLEQAEMLAERLHRQFHETSWPVEAVTASFGIACIQPANADIHSLVRAADRALYNAKAAGRDCIMLAS